jgi:hypothetical protein
MIKKDHLRLFLIFVFSSAFILSAHSQNRKYFIITGKVICGCAPSEDSFVQIIKLDRDSMAFPIQTNGKFRIELDYNSEYKLTFSQSDHSSKTIFVNTTIPEDVLARPANFSNFMMTIKLFGKEDASGNLYMENLVQLIAYSPLLDEFVKMPTLYEAQYVGKGTSLANRVNFR